MLPKPRRIVTSTRDRVTRGRLRLSEAVRPDLVPQPQGYRLVIHEQGIELTAHDDAGLFYGRQTLGQLQREGEVGACMIEDWPDFAVRGVMLDISRDKVPTMATLRELIDLLASLKINQLQLYTEHTFAYRNHRVVWEHASPLTHEEIRELDTYCRARFIELVPNQNSFGHMERWLKHPAYRDLAECPDGAFYWNQHRPAATLNPLDPRSLELVRELHAELLPCFSSKQFNVGCDETMELGMGRSKPEADRVGVGRVYLDFLKQIHAGVVEHGCTMQFWADIILKHPELVDELPRDVVALIWGYEADHPFDEQCSRVAASGRQFYVCPGTSSWCSLAGRTRNMLDNIRSAAEMGLRHGAVGLLNTDWGDLGHLQPLSVSYAGFAYAAAVSWCLQSNADTDDLATAINRHVVFDPQERTGQALLTLGDVYALPGLARSNGTVLFDLLVQKRAPRPELRDAIVEARQRADKACRMMAGASPRDAVVDDEVAYAALLLESACAIGVGETVDVMKLRESHARTWGLRNRPGGMADSRERLPAATADAAERKP